MVKANFGDRAQGLRRIAARVFQAAALALVFALAMPASAADTRAVKSRVAPIYPEIAQRLKISGAVVIEATVNAKGKVTAVRTISGNRLLSTAAEEAVQKWQFKSGAGETTVQVMLTFNL
jgi:TonB family protein